MPKNDFEKTSRKKPAARAENTPRYLWGFSKKPTRHNKIKTRFGIIPSMLKWFKKLLWSNVRK
ncbi:hypothetical protein L6274_00545 [Candidatus Parcubacteria bacterium]|nr:hypothetical protein [Candidatus Parcubacteria bacterium]